MVEVGFTTLLFGLAFNGLKLDVGVFGYQAVFYD